MHAKIQKEKWVKSSVRCTRVTLQSQIYLKEAVNELLQGRIKLQDLSRGIVILSPLCYFFHKNSDENYVMNFTFEIKSILQFCSVA